MQKYRYSRLSEDHFSSAFLKKQPDVVFNKVKYIGGWRPFDLFIYSDQYVENNHLITFEKSEKQLSIQIERGPFESIKRLYLSQISAIEINSVTDIAKNNNADNLAARAILSMNKMSKLFPTFNNLLLKDLKACDKLHYPELLLTIAYKEKGKTAYFLFGFADKSLRGLSKFAASFGLGKKAQVLKQVMVKVQPVYKELNLN